MKKLSVLLMVLALTIPSAASAGSANVSYWHTEPVATQPDGTVVGIWSAFHITNLLTVPQSVRIVLRNIDGTPAANHPLGVHNGTINGYPASTDGNGEFVVTVSAGALLAVEIDPVGDMTTAGYAIIEGTASKSLVASAVIYGRLPLVYAGTAFNYSVPVNGGSPF